MNNAVRSALLSALLSARLSVANYATLGVFLCMSVVGVGCSDKGFNDYELVGSQSNDSANNDSANSSELVSC